MLNTYFNVGTECFKSHSTAHTIIIDKKNIIVHHSYYILQTKNSIKYLQHVAAIKILN